MEQLDLVEGEGIGAIRIGTARSALPVGTVFEAGVGGEYAGIHFLLENDAVNEVWIPNLRTFPVSVRFKGQVIERQLALDALKQLFGPCARVAGVIGGARYRCDSGIVLGFDFKETGEFVQIRVQRKTIE